MQPKTTASETRRRPSATPTRVTHSIPTNGVDGSGLQRLLKDTAHDLKTPLTGIRESIRLLHDDKSVRLSDQQAEFVDIAIEQCETMRQMIEGLLRPGGPQSEFPPIQRSWMKTKTVCESIDRMITPSLPEGTDLYWDFETVADHDVFLDDILIQRLLSNLVHNAIRVSAPGCPLLVRLSENTNDHTVRWSVIDRGPGMSMDQLEQIIQREVSLRGSHGLGIDICTQIAALHLSTLEIATSQGLGTEISFETPASGPTSLANAWCRWRMTHAPSDVSSSMLGDVHPSSEMGNVPHSPRVLMDDKAGVARLDAAITVPSHRIPTPFGRMDASRSKKGTHRISLRHRPTQPPVEDRVVTGTVTLGAACPMGMADAFDRCFQHQMGPYDLVCRIHGRRWVWIFDTPVDQMEERLRSINEAAVSELGDARLHWSDPQTIGVNDRMKARVSDLLIRETLQAQSYVRPQDQDQVRLGTRPLQLSPVAAARLEEELVRLSERFQRQSRSLRRHAGELRST